jgi:DNA-binding NarL/FixJ family response regulator
MEITFEVLPGGVPVLIKQADDLESAFTSGRPETAIVMFSMFANKHFTELVRNVGLNGLVSKEGDGPALLSAIDAVKQNQTYFPVL